MFDPDKFLAEDTEVNTKKEATSFDPDSFLAEDSPKEELEAEDLSSKTKPKNRLPEHPRRKKNGKLTSAFLGTAAGLAGDFADEAAGVVLGAGDFLASGIQGKSKFTLEEFKKKRNKHIAHARQVHKQAASDNPLTYGAAQVGGAIVGAGKVGAAAKATKVGRAAIKQGVKHLGKKATAAGIVGTGLATEGAVHGLGGSEAKSIDDALAGAGSSLAFGAGLGLGGRVLKGMGKFVGGRFMPDAIKRKAHQGVKNATRKTDGDEHKVFVREHNFANPNAKNTMEESYQYALDEGIVKAGDTIKKITNKAQHAADAGTRNIDNAVKEYSKTFQTPHGLLDDVFNEALDTFRSPRTGALKQMRTAEVNLLKKMQKDAAADYGDRSLESMLLFKREIGQILEVANKAVDPDAGTVGVLQKLYNGANKSITKTLEEVSPELASKFVKGNKQASLSLNLLDGSYVPKSVYSMISDPAQKALTLGFAVNMVAPGAGKGVGAAVMSMEIGKEAVKRFGGTYVATSYNAVHKLMQKSKLDKVLNSKQFARVSNAAIDGPKALLRQHLLLLSTSPGYRSAVNGEIEE